MCAVAETARRFAHSARAGVTMAQSRPRNRRRTVARLVAINHAAEGERRDVECAEGPIGSELVRCGVDARQGLWRTFAVGKVVESHDAAGGVLGGERLEVAELG